MKTKRFIMKVTFTTPVLGAQADKEVASTFIAKRAGLDMLPDDERAALPDELDRGVTTFHRNEDGDPMLFNYQVKGWLKECGQVFNGQINGVRNLRSKISQYVFVSPRTIDLMLPQGTAIEYVERPLRAQTMQGPRVALAKSECLPEGTMFTCFLDIFPNKEITIDIIREFLPYGEVNGLGQWRSSNAYGTFTATIEELA